MPSIPILLLFLAIWSAHRFRFHGTTLFAIAVVSIAVYGTARGHGPFLLPSVNDSLLSMQMFFSAIIITGLIISSIVTREQETLLLVQKDRDDLEDIVECRVAELKNANLSLKNEIALRERTTQALQELHHTCTQANGKSVLFQCISDISKIYDTKFSFFGVFPDDNKDRIQTRIYTIGDRIAPNIEYALEGTPCKDVLNGSIECVQQGVADLYPDDPHLRDAGIESYFAVPLTAPSGATIGIVGVLDTKPLNLESWSKPLMELYASRIAFELEHSSREAEKALAETVFQSSAQAIAITDVDGSILRVNHMFEKTTGYRSEDIVGDNFRLLKSGKHDADFYDGFWDDLLHNGGWHGEIWNRRKNGEVFPIWQTVASVRDKSENRVKYYVSIFSDISERKQSEEQLYKLAHFDTLTGLCNRASFTQQLEAQIARSERCFDQFALIFLDLDHFKSINDAHGHQTGDELLSCIAQRIKHAVRKEDLVARLAGDEFVILVPHFESIEDLALIAQKILSKVSEPIHLEPFHSKETEIVITASLGISIFPRDGKQPTVLLQNADNAMYEAKKSGKNTFALYLNDMAENERLEDSTETA